MSKNNSFSVTTAGRYSLALYELAKENKLEEESQNLKQVLLNSLDDKVLGPVNAPIYRVKGKYRQRLLIRSKKGSKIQNKLAEILNKHKLPSEIKLTVDVDPITFN